MIGATINPAARRRCMVATKLCLAMATKYFYLSLVKVRYSLVVSFLLLMARGGYERQDRENIDLRSTRVACNKPPIWVNTLLLQRHGFHVVLGKWDSSTGFSLHGTPICGLL